MSNRKVLIIATEVATSGFSSGASMRVRVIKELLEEFKFDVNVTSRKEAKFFLKTNWDLIVLVSFASAKYLRKASKAGSKVWFDPTDSWTLTRGSLLRNGDLKQLPILLRDLYWLWTAPKFDLLTFITRRDADREIFWWRKRKSPIIFPIANLTRVVKSSEINRLVFMGDGSYGPNRKAIKKLKEILKFLPKTLQINVYGKGTADSDSGFTYHGYVESEDLYYENDIHLAPISSGAGLKMKVALPLANNLRVISSPEGAQGLKPNPNLIIAETPIDFARQIINLTGVSRESFTPIAGSIFLDDDTDQVKRWLRSFD